MDDKNKTLIQEKRKQIEQLQQEIKELQDPRNLISLVNEEMYRWFWDYSGNTYYPSKTKVKPTRCGDLWNCIKKLSLSLFGQDKVTDLTPEQMKVSAKMADDIIRIYNKYFEEEWI